MSRQQGGGGSVNCLIGEFTKKERGAITNCLLIFKNGDEIMGALMQGAATLDLTLWFLWPFIFLISFAIFIRSIVINADKASVVSLVIAGISLTIIIAGIIVCK